MVTPHDEVTLKSDMPSFGVVPVQGLRSGHPSFSLQTSVAAESQPKSTFDRLELIESVDGDFDILTELVELFLGQIPDSFNAIRYAISEGNSQGLNRASHLLKGSLGNFFAAEATKEAQALEDIGASGDMSGALESLVVLEDAVQRLRAELVSLIEKRE